LIEPVFISAAMSDMRPPLCGIGLAAQIVNDLQDLPIVRHGNKFALHQAPGARRHFAGIQFSGGLRRHLSCSTKGSLLGWPDQATKVRNLQ
jgi:hypothetical protein